MPQTQKAERRVAIDNRGGEEDGSVGEGIVPASLHRRGDPERNLKHLKNSNTQKDESGRQERKLNRYGGREFHPLLPAKEAGDSRGFPRPVREGCCPGADDRRCTQKPSRRGG